MNLKAKDEKILKTLAPVKPEKFLECLSVVEYNLQTTPIETSRIIAPQEANFQLPNVFLKTRTVFKAEGILSNNEFSANWNDKLDQAIKFLDSIDLSPIDESKTEDLDSKILESLLCYRNGKSI